MDIPIITLTFLLVVILFHGLSFFLSKSSKRLPPGPKPLPIIGNLNLLGTKPHESLAKLAKIYGPIMSLKFGRITTVVFSSSAVAKEVLQKQDLAFCNRFILDSTRAHNHHNLSVVWLPVSSEWRSLRKILNTNVFSSNILDANQHLRSRKIEELIEYCRKIGKTGESVDVGQVALRTSLNMLSNTIFSKDLTIPYKDYPEREFKDLISNIVMEGSKPNSVDSFPLLANFDPHGIRKNMAMHFGKVLKLFGDLINERLEKNKSQGRPENDVLDALLTANQENPEEIDRDQIEHMCMDLFVAGTDATSSTLEWAMTELLKNLDIMKKAKEELAQVIGKGGQIKENDIPNLPYLQCIVKETLRLHPPVPFLVPRRVEKDVEVNGYVIPKGSQVLVNAWAIGRDENVWENPTAFKPERFWGSEMDIRGYDYELIPFGGGRRICPGLPLAFRMLSIMLGSLLNVFEWKVEADGALTEMDMEERMGIIVEKAHPLKAIPISM